MSLFGLHRRLRGAIVGHLALLEMDSTQPNRRYGNGLRRLGYGADATDFYDEHVEADAVHEALAAHDLAGALAQDEPELAPDILFGARAMILIDEIAGRAASTTRSRAASRRYARRSPSRPTSSTSTSGTRSSRPAARKPISLCVPSQNGRICDLPQRHSAIVLRCVSIGVAVLVEDCEVAAHDVGTVAVRRDRRRLVVLAHFDIALAITTRWISFVPS